MTVTVKVIGVPEHPFKVGVVEIVEICCVVTDAAVYVGIFPVPLTAIPVFVLELLHANIAPVGVLVNVVAGIVAPAHIV